MNEKGGCKVREEAGAEIERYKARVRDEETGQKVMAGTLGLSIPLRELGGKAGRSPGDIERDTGWRRVGYPA